MKKEISAMAIPISRKYLETKMWLYFRMIPTMIVPAPTAKEIRSHFEYETSLSWSKSIG